MVGAFLYNVAYQLSGGKNGDYIVPWLLVQLERLQNKIGLNWSDDKKIRKKLIGLLGYRYPKYRKIQCVHNFASSILSDTFDKWKLIMFLS